MGNKNQDLLTSQVAKRLNCCQRTVRNLIKDRKLPGSYKVRGTWRIPPNTLENYRNKQIEEYHKKIFGLDRVPEEWKTEKTEKTEKAEIRDGF